MSEQFTPITPQTAARASLNSHRISSPISFQIYSTYPALCIVKLQVFEVFFMLHTITHTKGLTEALKISL